MGFVQDADGSWQYAPQDWGIPVGVASAGVLDDALKQKQQDNLVDQAKAVDRAETANATSGAAAGTASGFQVNAPQNQNATATAGPAIDPGLGIKSLDLGPGAPSIPASAVPSFPARSYQGVDIPGSDTPVSRYSPGEVAQIQQAQDTANNQPGSLIVPILGPAGMLQLGVSAGLGLTGAAPLPLSPESILPSLVRNAAGYESGAQGAKAGEAAGVPNIPGVGNPVGLAAGLLPGVGEGFLRGATPGVSYTFDPKAIEAMKGTLAERGEGLPDLSNAASRAELKANVEQAKGFLDTAGASTGGTNSVILARYERLRATLGDDVGTKPQVGNAAANTYDATLQRTGDPEAARLAASDAARAEQQRQAAGEAAPPTEEPLRAFQQPRMIMTDGGDLIPNPAYRAPETPAPATSPEPPPPAPAASEGAANIAPPAGAAAEPEPSNEAYPRPVGPDLTYRQAQEANAAAGMRSSVIGEPVPGAPGFATPAVVDAGVPERAPAYAQVAQNLTDQGWTNTAGTNAFRSPSGEWTLVDQDGGMQRVTGTGALANATHFGDGGPGGWLEGGTLRGENGMLTSQGRNAVATGDLPPDRTGGTATATPPPPKGVDPTAWKQAFDLVSLPTRILTTGAHVFRIGAQNFLSHPTEAFPMLKNYVEAWVNPEGRQAIQQQIENKPFVGSPTTSYVTRDGVTVDVKPIQAETFRGEGDGTFVKPSAVQKAVNATPILGEVMKRSAEAGSLWTNGLRDMLYNVEADRSLSRGEGINPDGSLNVKWFKDIYNQVSHDTGHGFNEKTPGVLTAVGIGPSALAARVKSVADIVTKAGTANPLGTGARANAVRDLMAVGGTMALTSVIGKMAGAKVALPFGVGGQNATDVVGPYGIESKLFKAVTTAPTGGKTAYGGGEGYDSLARFVGNMALDAMSGDVKAGTDHARSWLEGLSGPVAGTMLDLALGTDWRGDPFGPRGGDAGMAALKGELNKGFVDKWAPIAASNMAAAYKEWGTEGLLRAAPSLGGYEASTTPPSAGMKAYLGSQPNATPYGYDKYAEDNAQRRADKLGVDIGTLRKVDAQVSPTLQPYYDYRDKVDSNVWKIAQDRVPAFQNYPSADAFEKQLRENVMKLGGNADDAVKRNDALESYFRATGQAHRSYLNDNPEVEDALKRGGYAVPK